MNHRVITLHLLLESRTNGRPEVVGPRPVGTAINRATVAQNNGGLLSVRRDLQLALNEKNCALSRPPNSNRFFTWESASKYDAGGFRKNFYVFTKVLSDQFKNCSLAGARTTP